MKVFCLALLFQEIDGAILETSHAGLNVAVVFSFTELRFYGEIVCLSLREALLGQYRLQ